LRILDDEGNQLNAASSDEVTITSWHEGMPLLRYRTGELLLFIEPCACGRNTKSPVARAVGRKSQMINIKALLFFLLLFTMPLSRVSEVKII